MSVWFTSDHHVSHRLVAELRWRDAFPDIEMPMAEHVIAWHDQLLAQNWDAVVIPGDTVWVAGDISSGTDKAQRAALDWFSHRPGTVHLVDGNHDGPHPMHRDSYKWQQIYLAHPKARDPRVKTFASVSFAVKRRILLPKEGHVSVILNHMPYRLDRGPETRYPEWRLPNCGLILVHGHTHSTDIITYDDGTPQIHIGLDAHNLSPVHGDTLRDLVWEVLGVKPESE